MARLSTKSFELNSATAGVEWSDVVNGPTVVSSPVRSGTYAGSIPSLTSGQEKFFEDVFATSDQSGNLFTRFYLYITTLPNVDTTIAAFIDSGGSQVSWIDLATDGTLALFDSGFNFIGNTSALNTGQWYRIEHKHGDTANIVELKIDGSVVATTSTGTVTGAARYRLGGNIFTQATTTISIQFDDYALNDASGSAQTGYPGDGKIVHLHPNAAGDNAATAGLFSAVDEVTPNDATDFIDLDTGTTIADYNMEASSVPGIGSGDTISLVSVGIRIREEAAAATSYQLRIKSASGGTTATSTSSDAGDTTWRTNPNGTTSFIHRLVSYTDPTTASAWTPTGTNSLDNMQIGVAALNTNDIDVSTLWAAVEYVPAATTTSTSSTSSSISTSSTSSSISTSSTSRSTSTSSTSSSISVSTSSTSRSISTSSTSSSISISTSSTSSSISVSTSSTSSSISVSTSSTSRSISTSSTSSSISVSTSSTSSSISVSTSSTSSSISTSSTSSSISVSTSSTSSSISVSTSSTSASISISTSSTSSSTSLSISTSSTSSSISSSSSISTSSTSASTSTTTVIVAGSDVNTFPRPRIRPQGMYFGNINRPPMRFR